jgi:hypothetical protein
MTKSTPLRFSVRPENETAAVAYIKERGYSPAKIEKGRDDGLAVLIFAPLPDDQIYGLIQALPTHLSAKLGIMMGNRPPFGPDDANEIKQ